MRRLVSLSLLALLLVVLAACASGPVETPKEVVRYANFSVYDAAVIAAEKGLYDHLDVQVVGTNFGGPTAIQAVASGKAEAGLSSYMAIASAVAAGLPIASVADCQSEIAGNPKEVFLVRADSPVQSVQDLAGETIAINLVKSSFHYTWLIALANAGMKESDVTFVNLPFPAQGEALARGDVQAIGLIEPLATFAERAFPGQFRRLFTGTDVFGPRQFCAIFVNTIWARENPEAAARFIAGVKAGAVWANANPTEANAVMEKYIGGNGDYTYKFQPDGGIVQADADYWVDWMKANKYITADWLTGKDVVYSP